MKVVGVATTNPVDQIAPLSDMQISDYLSVNYETLKRLL